MSPLRFLVLAGLLAMPNLARAEAPVWHRVGHIATRLEADGRYDSIQSWDVTTDSVGAAHQAAEQSFGFAGGLEQARVLEAYTLKPDGTRLAVSPDAILHQGLAAGVTYPSFSDWQARTIIFPDVEPGDTVHFTIERRAKVALFPGQYETTLQLGPTDNVTEADIALDLPAGMEIRAAAWALAEGPAFQVGDRVVRHWHLTPGGPGPSGTGPVGPGGIVQLQLSTFRDYAAIGDAYAADALPKAAVTPAIRAKAAELIANAGLGASAGSEEKARALYAYVARSVRYVGLQIGRGRMVPHDAETVMRLGYGDCKDHVTLLIALLDAAGIRAEPALISTGPGYDLPALPTMSPLDHVIVYLPDLDRYADSTSPFAPFGVLPFGEYGKPVILARLTGSTIARVPALPAGLAVARARTDLRVDADGTMTGDTVTVADGPAAITLREVASAIADEGPFIAAQNQLRRLGTPGAGDFSFATPLDPGESYGMRGHFTLDDKFADAQDDRFTLPPGLTVLSRGTGFLVADDPGAGGGHLCYAGEQAETINLHLPKGVVVIALPPALDLAAGFAHYQARYTNAGDTLTVTRRFTVTAPHPLCTAAEFDAMRPVLIAARHDARTELPITHTLTVGTR